MQAVAVTHPSLPINHNVQVKIPLWRRIALLVTALVATVFSLGLALCSTRVLNWYKEFWFGHLVVVRVKSEAPKPTAVVLNRLPEKPTVAPQLVEVKNEEGDTPLMQAVWDDSLKIVQELLKKGEKPDVKDEEGNNLLHLAKSAQMVEALLKAAPYLIDAVNENGDTPLITAAADDYGEIVEVLLKNGAKVDVESMDGSTALHFARSGRVAEMLLSKAPDLIKSVNADGNTPLINAVWEDCRDVVEVLLKKGANTVAANNFGTTALHCARSVQVVEMLLAVADTRNALDQRDDKRRTPLMSAAINDRPEVVKALLARNANAYAKDEHRNTPLHFAKSAASVQMLAKQTELLELENEQGNTPLIMAADNDGAGAVKALIEKKVDVFAKNKYGNSALHVAKSAPVVQMLLETAPALINLQNIHGETPLMIAAWNGHLEVVQELLKSGAKIDVKNKNGETALNCARSEEVKALFAKAS